tara:strand:+ start:510 stop:617 length:108 start_codon:yes stop_codon:yes gene_type:complete
VGWDEIVSENYYEKIDRAALNVPVKIITDELTVMV